MATYVIIEVEVTDNALHEEYRQSLTSTIDQLGGRRLMNTAKPQSLTGDWQPRHLILIEFPGVAEAERYVTALGAGEYAAMRARCIGERNVVIAEGL